MHKKGVSIVRSTWKIIKCANGFCNKSRVCFTLKHFERGNYRSDTLVAHINHRRICIVKYRPVGWKEVVTLTTMMRYILLKRLKLRPMFKCFQRRPHRHDMCISLKQLFVKDCLHPLLHNTEFAGFSSFNKVIILKKFQPGGKTMSINSGGQTESHIHSCNKAQQRCCCCQSPLKGFVDDYCRKTSEHARSLFHSASNQVIEFVTVC